MTTDGGTVDRGTGVTTISDGGVFRDDRDEVQDTTAGELFAELQAENGTDGPDAEFGDSAEAIVDGAEGHSHERFTDGGQAIAAGKEVENLLIPDREEGDEFHWVNTGDGDGDESARTATAVDDETATGDAKGSPDSETEGADESGGLLGKVRSLFGGR
ncbi:hypothetical protein [Halostella salina]|uniref:hypothetical protein n=1 Tax=Halostella salina TaxID=1547897 RepID=UPI000EF7C26D|nr:hypothetical protein [Halostella salina]